MRSQADSGATDARRHGPTPDPRQREALLAAASTLLATEGPAALTVRRIAAEAGYSTMGVYSRFGGKEGIVEELFVDGFRRLRAAMEAAQSADPFETMVACGRSYRRFGLEHPTSYQIMFERVVPGYVPSEAAQLEGLAAFGVLVARVTAAQDAGVLGAGEPAELAHRFWAASHGWVSLEIHGLGWLGAGQERAYDDAMAALIGGMRPDAASPTKSRAVPRSAATKAAARPARRSPRRAAG